MRLTKNAISHAQLPEPSRKVRYIGDDLVRGLGIGITERGVKSFVFEARIKGQPRRITIGRWPDCSLALARQKAIKIRAAIARGEDPHCTHSQQKHKPLAVKSIKYSNWVILAEENRGMMLKQLRSDNSYTLRDLASKVGFSAVYLSKIENGHAKPPHQLLVRMAKAFRLPKNQHQEFIFAARHIPKQIREIAYTFPRIAPKFFRKALKNVADRSLKSRIR